MAGDGMGPSCARRWSAACGWRKAIAAASPVSTARSTGSGARFFAGVLSYPFYLVLLTMRVSLAEWEAAGGLRIILVETIGYVIAWVAFPLLMLSVLRWIGREHRFFDFMVPYNWCQLPQSVLFVLVGLESETRHPGRSGRAGNRGRRRHRRPCLRVVHRPGRPGDERRGSDARRPRRSRARRGRHPRRRQPLLDARQMGSGWSGRGGVKVCPEPDRRVSALTGWAVLIGQVGSVLVSCDHELVERLALVRLRRRSGTGRERGRRGCGRRVICGRIEDRRSYSRTAVRAFALRIRRIDGRGSADAPAA